MKTELQGYSDCCDQPIYSMDQRCPQCGEHCQVIKEEDREPRTDEYDNYYGSDLRSYNKDIWRDSGKYVY